VKAKELLSELQNLDMDIQSRIDEINELEAGLLSSPKWSEVKVKGGQPRKIDDVYAQLITMKDAIEQDTKTIIDRKLELSRMINRLSNPKYRTILRMTYINKMYADDICDSLGGISLPTYYRLKKQAMKELDSILSELIANDSDCTGMKFLN
jgi:phage protein